MSSRGSLAVRRAHRVPAAGSAAGRCTGPESMDRASVVVAVYNGQSFLAEQLSSVLADLRADDEVIVVDDASTDDSASLIRSLGDDRIRLVQNARNRGILKAFETGLSRVSNDIVFLCDQDDVWLPGKRDRVVEQFATDSRIVVVVSDAQVIDESGRVLAESFMTGRGGFRGSFASTLWKNRYLGCAMAFRRSVLRSALPIPAKVPMHDMWLGAIASLHGRAVYVDVPTIRYRRHGGNHGRLRHASLPRMIVWRWRLLSAVSSRYLKLRALGIVASWPARRAAARMALSAEHHAKRVPD